jgi:hypothetical protein
MHSPPLQRPLALCPPLHGPCMSDVVQARVTSRVLLSSSCEAVGLLLSYQRPTRLQVHAHFLERGAWIMQCCERYMAGEAVCSLPAFPGTGSASSSSATSTTTAPLAESCSDGFKILLRKIIPKLQEAFVRLGCSLAPTATP